jgi:hypothetical protein
MAAVVYYYGWESLAEWAVEADGFFGTPPASAAFNGFGYLRSATISVDENVEQTYNIGQTSMRKPDKAVKSVLDATGTLTCWLPDDLDATALDVWLLKMGLDAFNVAFATDRWVIPNTGTSVYGSNVLPSFTLEIGHNKTGAIRMHQLTGCNVDSMTLKARKGEKVELALNIVGKSIKLDEPSYTNGSATRSTTNPLMWANCSVEYGNDGSSIPVTDITGLEITFSNNLIANRALAESSFLIDACDVTTGWTGSADAAAAATNTTTYKEGGISLALGKTGTSTTACTYTKTITATDINGKKVLVWVYIADGTTLTALDVSAAANNYIDLGTGGTTNYNRHYMGTGLAVGWNLIVCDSAAPDTTGGTGADETLIDTLKIGFKTDATSTTFASAKVIMDYWRVQEPRTVNNYIVGRQDISGTMTINLTTTAGMAMYGDLTNDSSAPYAPGLTALNKEIKLRMSNLSNLTTQYLEVDLRNVTIGAIPMDFNPEKHTELTVPFTAQYYAVNIVTPDTSAPTNWDDQS